jgi:L-idonate 5-dehydrogenase
MRAVVARGAHDVRVEEIEAQPPGAGEVEVAIAVGGICGSDLHYFHRGGVGDAVIRQPLVLGHEVAGTVTRAGDAVSGLEPGDPVAIDPSRPCGECGPCRAGATNLCEDMRFLGSAARLPHTQGGFRDRLVVAAGQCVLLSSELPLDRAVLAEPLAVAFHAAERAGDLDGRRVLVVGSGPIGVLIAVAAREAGASAVIVADLLEGPLRIARELAATHVVDLGAGDEVGTEIDIAFEAAGAAESLETALAAVRAGGRVVCVGHLPPGQVGVAANRAVTRELELCGSYRFTHDQFRGAVEAIASGLDLSPLVTSAFPLHEALAAFEEASSRERAMKVQLVVGDW